MNIYFSKWEIIISYQKYLISISSPYVITLKKKNFPKKLLVATSSKGKKINFLCC